MQEIVEKAKRLRRVRSVSVHLRPEVYEELEFAASNLGISISTFIRGILEDFYDKHYSDAQEVPMDE